MRNLLLLALLGTFALSAPYAAAQSASETPSKPPVTAADLDKQMAQMQENLKRMQQLMDQVHKAKDPKVRHELMDEHAKTMQENMEMMRGMGGPTMAETMREHQTGGMGPGMAGGGGTGGEKGATGPGMMGGGQMMGGNPMAGMDPKQQQEFIQRRMDMMQMMMEQIMRHELMLHAAPAK